MGKKKVEHVVFDGMRKIKKKYNISEYNKKTHRDERQGILKKSDLTLAILHFSQKR